MPLSTKGLEVGQTIPYWVLNGPDGNPVRSSSYLGRPLLLFFFRGTWCPSCRAQMAHIKAVWAQLEPLTQVVGIIGEDLASVSRYLTRNPLPFLLLSDPNRQVIEAHNLYQKWGLNGFNIAHPSTLIIDQEGIVRYCYVGSSRFDRPELPQVIDELKALTNRELSSLPNS